LRGGRCEDRKSRTLDLAVLYGYHRSLLLVTYVPDISTTLPNLLK